MKSHSTSELPALGTRIVSRAPTRVDLAGGTLDIWPIHLLLGEPSTLNLGIDLCAEAHLHIQKNSGSEINLESADQGHKLGLSWLELKTASFPPALELHGKLLRYFAQANPGFVEKISRSDLQLTLRTQAKSPAGAGLGGSSTLSISILGALHRLFYPTQALDSETRTHLIEIARDVETTVIRVPAGLQDYYGAAFGGLQLLTWGAAGHKRTALPSDILKSLLSRLLLFYSGQSRNSGINNWVLFKSFIDGDASVRDRFQGIASATQELQSALLARDWKGAGQAIAREWSIRRNFAAGISTPEIDRAFETAFELGATAGKICGAGGGGCFFIWTDEENPSLHQKIVASLTQLGVRHLPFTPVENGLDVSVQVD